ncbi:MAG: hypothetical protein FD133_871 [Erysipelotrichaceae bacterium]|nr:MAG: hypothetical protein FD133_871 [Erysipelotrichaceae bacterium]
MIVRNKWIENQLKKSQTGKMKKYLDEQGCLYNSQVLKNKEGIIPLDYEVYAIVQLKRYLVKPSVYYLTIINQDFPKMSELIPVDERDVEIINPSLPKSWITTEFKKPLEIISSQFGQEFRISKVSGYRNITEDMTIFACLWDDNYSDLPERVLKLANRSEEELQ